MLRYATVDLPDQTPSNPDPRSTARENGGKHPERRLFQQSVAARDEVIGFRLFDRTEVAVSQIDRADRERDPEHDD